MIDFRKFEGNARLFVMAVLFAMPWAVALPAAIGRYQPTDKSVLNGADGGDGGTRHTASRCHYRRRLKLGSPDFMQIGVLVPILITRRI